MIPATSLNSGHTARLRMSAKCYMKTIRLCGSQGKTPWRTIEAQIYVDIRDNPNSPFVKIDSKPRKFFLKNLVSESELKEIEEREKEKIEKPKKLHYSERELHPFLTYYT